MTNENTMIFKCAKSNSFVKTVDRVFLNCRTKAAPQVAHFIPKKKKKLVKRSSLCCFFPDMVSFVKLRVVFVAMLLVCAMILSMIENMQ